VTPAPGRLLLWGGASVVCSRLQGAQPFNCTWSYEATVFLCVARSPLTSHSAHTVPRLDPDTWVWTALQAASAAAPQPSLYPVAQAGPDNSLFVYAGCAVSPPRWRCDGSALSSAAFFGSVSRSSSVTWVPVDSATGSAPLYGACAASPWPHASFEPDASYSHSGAAIVAGGITLSSTILPSLPLTVFSFDSASALTTVGGSALPSNPAPQPRAFSACSLMGISDYFIMCDQRAFAPPPAPANACRMYGGSGRDAAGKVTVFEDLSYFAVPDALKVQRRQSCLQRLPCLIGVSIVLGWASGGVALSTLLLLSSPASYKRSLSGTRFLWLLFGLLGTHRCVAHSRRVLRLPKLPV
jgi:hypothetical protein